MKSILINSAAQCAAFRRQLLRATPQDSKGQFLPVINSATVAGQLFERLCRLSASKGDNRDDIISFVGDLAVELKFMKGENSAPCEVELLAKAAVDSKLVRFFNF